ncbi:MAG: hypothetical protein N2486_10365 [Caloramator sp.]|nr:hypothetical protein [Caloramator sp.]
MVFKPDEVKSLRKGQIVNVEIDGKIMLLRRNFCGVYELFSPRNQRHIEYFDNLNFFKIRYGNLSIKFPITNIMLQRNEIYALSKKLSKEEILKWFSKFGRLNFIGSKSIDEVEIEYYTWISDYDGSKCEFCLADIDGEYTLNIPKMAS